MYDALVEKLSKIGEVVSPGPADTYEDAVEAGEILNVGNLNCRVRVQKPIPEFFDDWCRQ